jgi:hypothetical protein
MPNPAPDLAQEIEAARLGEVSEIADQIFNGMFVSTCHDPNWTTTPKTIGASAPSMFPAMFIIPDTVPECSPPISMETAQEGPMLHSRQNMAAVRQ